MALDDMTPRSRRAVLGAALGVAAGAAAAVVGRVTPVAAANGEAVEVGGDHTGTVATRITNTSGGPAVHGTSTGGGIGVRGDSDNIGLQGDGSPDGTGVRAHSASGRGLAATSDDGIGASITTDTGEAALLVEHHGSGIGLDVLQGRVRFNQVSGVATLAAGKTSVVVDPGVNVTTDAFVLLTPRASLGGRDLWYRTMPGKDRFSINLSRSRPIGTKIAWLLLES